MEEKLLELLKSILLSIKELDNKLHIQSCVDEDTKAKFTKELSSYIKNHREDSNKLIIAVKTKEDNQTLLYDNIENGINNLEYRFNSFIEGDSFQQVNEKYQLISNMIKDDFKKIEDELEILYHNNKKITNSNNFYWYSILTFIISICLNVFISFNLISTSRNLNNLEVLNLEQYQLGNVAIYFKDNPDKYKSYKKWDKQIKQQKNKSN